MTTQLYLISPPRIELADFRKQLEAAFVVGREGEARRPSKPSAHEVAHHVRAAGEHGGNQFVGAFQLRLKDADDAEIKAAIKELLPICKAHEVAFILNDRPDLCEELKCDGVHLGQEDLEKMPIAKARKIIGEETVLGVTCHASKHLAMEAGEQGADYVAFGAFYPTTSKPKEKLEKWGTPTPDIIEWWTTFATLPCVAIGGITPANCKPLVSAGADFIAVINAVWNHPKGVQVAIQEFKKEML
jgi:thiamine-phosphate pyrophosphorylase